ncbi:MAG: hypothetical protein GXY05_06975 [Clostridiales bacterium]|nr:hypothetical protein [Clostridiales bacterium]
MQVSPPVSGRTSCPLFDVSDRLLQGLADEGKL